MVAVYLTFKENMKLFFKVTTSFYILTRNVYDGFSFSTSLPTLRIIGLFDYNYSNSSIMVSLCGLNVHFSND